MKKKVCIYKKNSFPFYPIARIKSKKEKDYNYDNTQEFIGAVEQNEDGNWDVLNDVNEVIASSQNRDNAINIAKAKFRIDHTINL